MRRRKFLAVGSAAALGTGMAWWFARSGSAQRDGLQRGPKGIVDLPPGFSYRILERAGGPMDDGMRVPARADGMACFTDAQGRWVLMRNHEISRGKAAHGPYPPGAQPAPEAYHPDGYGGVSRLVVDPVSGQRVSSNLVLVGTARNCAGGTSPWGWLSCEESQLPGHGYVFLCDPEATQVAKPQPIRAYGQFNHEAVAIDPKTRAAYLTEDQPDGCLYRFLPSDAKRPFEGKLQALAIPGKPRFDTGSSLRPGDTLPIQWLDLPDRKPDDRVPLRAYALSAGAAVVRRGEGIWWGGRECYLTATVGGPLYSGQVFQLKPDHNQLTLVAQSHNPATLSMPDNLTVTPWGELLLCEDGMGVDHLRLVGMDGSIRAFARNATGESEFAGVCFSPDGSTLFVNIQEVGLTLSIRGPWPA